MRHRRLSVPRPIALVLAALALATAAVPAAAQSPSPDGSPVPGPSAPAIRAGTLPSEGGAVEPGTYSDWSLGPTLTFTLGPGWGVTPVDAGFGLALVRTDQPAIAVLTISSFTGDVFVDPCLAEGEETMRIDPTPEALVTELGANPSLIVGPPEETTLAGLPALEVEVGMQMPMACEPPVTWIWATPPTGGFVLEGGEEARFTLAALDAGTVLVASAEAWPGADLAELVAATDALLATLEIGPPPGA
ncbi:MAG: hypothetical protein ACKOTZ_02520 [Chloroflexota bacterium]